MIAELSPKAKSPRLDSIIESSIKKRSLEFQRKLNIRKIVAAERRKLDKQWKKSENHSFLAPGSELVEAVFAHFGVSYSKPADTKLIATKLSAAQIPHEINALIKRIQSLPKSTC